MPYDRKRPQLDACPVETVLAIVAGKWKVRVLYLLSLDALTFGELRKAIPGSRQQVLSALLKDLEADRVVERHRWTTPNHSLYGLTVEGRDLVAVLHAVAAWGDKRLAGHGIVWKPPTLPLRAAEPGLHRPMAAKVVEKH